MAVYKVRAPRILLGANISAKGQDDFHLMMVVCQII